MSTYFLTFFIFYFCPEIFLPFLFMYSRNLFVLDFVKRFFINYKAFSLLESKDSHLFAACPSCIKK